MSEKENLSAINDWERRFYQEKEAFSAEHAEVERLREERDEWHERAGHMAEEVERLQEENSDLKTGMTAALKRLHRTEEAVRAYVEKNSGYGHGSGLDPLRAALGGQ